MLSRGADRIILASADLDLHIALTFNSGIRPNAGGVNRSSNTANNTKARNIRTPHAIGSLRNELFPARRRQNKFLKFEYRKGCPGAAVARAGAMCRLIKFKTSYLPQTTGALRKTPGGGSGGPKSRCQTLPSSN
jgi:hypothetical protein